MTRMLAITVLFSGLLVAEVEAQELKGSPESIQNQWLYAKGIELKFFETEDDVALAKKNGLLVPLWRNPKLMFVDVWHEYVLPTTRAFIDMFEKLRPQVCGQELVITGASRSLERLPPNGSLYTVHVTGMSVDFRIPESLECRQWFERTLLKFEGMHIIDVTLETSPWHYHIAVFPTRFEVSTPPRPVSTNAESH